MIGAPLPRTTAVVHPPRLWRLQNVALLRLLRPTNALPAAVVVLLGPRLLGVQPLPASVWWAAVAMACVTAFGYVTNDLADIAEDRVNKPDRPLPSGLVSVPVARALAIFLAALSLACAAFVSTLALVVAGGVLTLLALYNHHLKATPGPGNALIGALAGGAIYCGGVAANGLDWATVHALTLPALCLALFVTAREVLKTLEDLPGDRAAGKQTLALRYGAQAVPAVLLPLAWLTTAIVAATKIHLAYSWGYLLIISIGVLLPLHASALDLARRPQPLRARRWLRVLKGSYAAGILALFFA